MWRSASLLGSVMFRATYELVSLTGGAALDQQLDPSCKSNPGTPQRLEWPSASNLILRATQVMISPRRKYLQLIA